MLGPRLHHHGRLQAADDVAGPVAAVALEARDVILMTVSGDHCDQIVADDGLDVVCDLHHPILRRQPFGSALVPKSISTCFFLPPP